MGRGCRYNHSKCLLSEGDDTALIPLWPGVRLPTEELRGRDSNRIEYVGWKGTVIA
jgi:hypothetical protein